MLTSCQPQAHINLLGAFTSPFKTFSEFKTGLYKLPCCFGKKTDEQLPFLAHPFEFVTTPAPLPIPSLSILEPRLSGTFHPTLVLPSHCYGVGFSTADHCGGGSRKTCVCDDDFAHVEFGTTLGRLPFNDRSIKITTPFSILFQHTRRWFPFKLLSVLLSLTIATVFLQSAFFHSYLSWGDYLLPYPDYLLYYHHLLSVLSTIKH